MCQTVQNCAKLCKTFELSLVFHALAEFCTVWHISTQLSKKKISTRVQCDLMCMMKVVGDSCGSNGINDNYFNINVLLIVNF